MHCVRIHSTLIRTTSRKNQAKLMVFINLRRRHNAAATHRSRHFKSPQGNQPFAVICVISSDRPPPHNLGIMLQIWQMVQTQEWSVAWSCPTCSSALRPQCPVGNYHIRELSLTSLPLRKEKHISNISFPNSCYHSPRIEQRAHHRSDSPIATVPPFF